MLSLRVRSRVSVIAADFGTCALRAVQLARQGNRWWVHHWVNLEKLPTGENPAPAYTPEDVALAFGEGTFSGRRVNLLMNPPAVGYHMLEVPGAVLDQPGPALQTALQIELDKQLEWPAAETEMSAWAVRDGGKGRVPALVVAAHRPVLLQRLALLGQSGLNCERADVLPNALTALAADPSTHSSPGTEVLWGVLDLGFTSSRLYLLQGDRPVYARVLRTGGRELTATLAKALQIDFPLAEKYKRLYGIQPGEGGTRSVMAGVGQVAGDDMPGVLFAILRPALEGMVQEIARSFRFVVGQTANLIPGGLMLVGGGARLKGLGELLEAQLSLQVRAADFARLMDRGPSPGGADRTAASAGSASAGWKSEHDGVMAGCVGLALGEEGGS